MTIALSIKVNDGLVLAADSASTIIAQTANGPTVVQVYNNANKVFNVRKGLPIGAMTWGSGAIGQASISTLMKDLRVRLSGDDPDHRDWHLDAQTYTVRGVADQVKRYFYDELYVPEYADWQGAKPEIGFMVAGYSPGCGLAEEFRIDIGANGDCSGPQEARPIEQSGMAWFGQPEAIYRLILGYSTNLASVLAQELRIPQEQVDSALQAKQPELAAQVFLDAMPIQDVIDLAAFLVDLTCKFTRYTPGAATVGGPVEIAAITKHEGFKWVKRKHYFTSGLNPEG